MSWADFEADRARVAAEASIALALGAWLALVVAALVVVACVYGAAWINGIWLAPFAGLAR